MPARGPELRTGPNSGRLQSCVCAGILRFMETPACIRLPYMRPAMNPALAGFRTLWPGHADPMPETAWRPANYPLKPAAAASFLQSLELMGCDELDAMRNAWSASQFSAFVNDSEELASIGMFAGRPRLRGAFEAALELAQQLLLWSWRQEQILGELKELERECLLKEQAIPENFLEAGAARGAAEAASPGMELSWRPVVANAAFFISPAQAILAEGRMAEELPEFLEFKKPDSGGFGLKGGGFLEARGPLWQALGHSGPARTEAAKIYNPERVWLVWRGE